MSASPQWRDGRFHNPQPLWNNTVGALTSLFRRSPHARPKEPLPVVRPEQTSPGSGLAVTWMGHSTLLVEVDGTRILTDPVWSERASPLGWVGPRRFHPTPVALETLAVPDAVVISHDHYDHLDRGTIRRIKDWPTRFIVPLGVGRRLAAWGVPEARITELDWWGRTKVATLEIVCAPARHASGRGIFDKDRTLWAGYAFLGAAHRVYFSGDTGLFDGLADIGTRLGPFDLTLIESGAYGQAWPDWHLGPEQAVQAHGLVQGKVMLPIHWGTFQLASHGWTEPVERVLVAAAQADVQVLVPRPGERLEPGSTPPQVRWWPSLPHQTAAESPIVATSDGLRPAFSR